MPEHAITLSNFVSFNVAIVVYFLGVALNRRIRFLERYNIPEPVSGGLLVAILSLLLHLLAGLDIVFSLAARDFLLLYFFTAIGLNARLSDLISGGRPLAVLLVLTLVFMIAQNMVGVLSAQALGLPGEVGLIGGTIALVGGHGTAIAWGPILSTQYGISGAVELGAAAATLGLIAASLLGGPIADHLIVRKGATPGPAADQTPTVGLEHEHAAKARISHTSLMASLLVLNVAIGIGTALKESLDQIGFDLPLFVVCLFCGILLSNTVPRLMPRLPWPAHTQSLSVVSDLALGVFLSMSLMSLQLWTIADLAGPMLVILALQVLCSAVFIVFVLFPLMGRDYEAAVLSAGFAGFALGATPTAIANMTAVTKHYGAALRAFVILPLVSAFFVDLANALLIRIFLSFG